MSRPLRLEFPDALYHVTARGNEQRAIFRTDEDRELYLQFLAHYRNRFRYRIYAYCLMTNHVHLAVQTAEPPLSRIVLALHGRYAQAFNRRHGRVGHLFQGRYKAYLVQKTAYLQALVRYIHENPVKAGLVSRPGLYRWSSERFYEGKRPPAWLDTREVLGMFDSDSTRALRQYVAFMRRDLPEPYEDLTGVVKGDDAFSRIAFERLPPPQVPRRPLTVEEIALAVSKAVGISTSEMQSGARDQALARAREVVAHLASRSARIPLSRAAVFFRRDGSTLVRDLRRFDARASREPGLEGLVSALRRTLGL